MKNILLLLCFLFILCSWSKAMVCFPEKLVVVLAQDWQSSQGKLYCMQKNQDTWKVVSHWAVMLGKNGMGWGRGIALPLETQGPEKKEGDGKSPAGLFALRRILYGYDLSAPCQIVWPYQMLTTDCIGVDDPDSVYYNQILHKSKIKKIDWNSYEEMRRKDILYRWLLVVEHNTQNTIPGAGSCIFLHLSKDSSTPTAGCTAMKEEELLFLVEWLGKEENPLLLQLPVFLYEKLRKSLPKNTLGDISP